MTPTLQQYGLQRTGTNAIRYLIEANFHALVTTSGKHDPPHPRQNLPAGLIVSVRDPLSWLASYYRLRRMKIRDRGEIPPPIRDVADEYLDLWRERTEQHLSLYHPDHAVVVVQNEAVVRSPMQEAIRVADRLGLSRRAGQAFEIPTQRLRRGSEGQPVRMLRGPDVLDRHSILSGSPAHTLPREMQRKGWLALESLISQYPEHIDHFDLAHLENL